MATFSELAEMLLRKEVPKPRPVAPAFGALKELLLDELTVETRFLVSDYAVTHAVEVDKNGKVQRVLCGTVKAKDLAPLRLYTVPTCSKCVHVDAQPVTCPVNAKRRFNLEMRRIGADPVERARIAAEGRARAERDAKEEAERAEAEEAGWERARLRSLQAEAAALSALAPANATGAQIARANDLCAYLAPPDDRGITRWHAQAVEAAQRRTIARPAEAERARRPPEQPTTRLPHPTTPHVTTARPAPPNVSARAPTAGRVPDPSPHRPPRADAQAHTVPTRSQAAVSSKAQTAGVCPSAGAATAPPSASTVAAETATRAASSPQVPPRDPAEKMRALERLLRAGPWARPVLGKDIMPAFASGDLPRGAVDALRELVGSASADAAQVGRVLHWVTTQPPVHGMRLNCRKDRNKFSWWQVVPDS